MPTTAGDIYVRSGASGSFTAVEYVQGGWITVASSSTMRSIYHDRIEDGQVAYVKSSNELYIASKFVAFSTPGYSGTVDSASWAKLIWPSASVSVAGGGGGGGVTISNNVNNRVLTGDGSNANAEANFTFDGSELVLTGNATITGNFEVQGTQTTIDSTTLNVADKNITIGSGSTTSAQIDAGGIDFGLGGSLANLRYKHSNTSISSSVDFRAPNFYGKFNGALSSSAQIGSDISGSLSKAHLISKVPNLVSSSAQIASNISGSLGANATLIRTLTGNIISGSLGPNATLIRSLTATNISGSTVTQSFSDGTAAKISGSLISTGSFGRVEVSANTIAIGGTPINKTLVDNVKLSFSATEAQSADTLETSAATGSFSGFVSSSLFLLSEVQGAQLTPQAGGIMFSGSAFYLGFE